jgi:DNA-binding response OmpR family regulator
MMISYDNTGIRRYAMTTLSDMEATKLTNAVQFLYQDAHLKISLADGLAVLDSRRLTLTRKEYQLLAVLVENAGKLIPREVLLMRVWGYGDGIRTRTLDVHIRRLRKHLGSYSHQYIETIFGFGYRFQPVCKGLQLEDVLEPGIRAVGRQELGPTARLQR